MTMSRWDPFRELDDFSRRLSRMFSMTPSRREGEETMASAQWMPTVDISETPEDYVVTAELPGIDKEDIDLSLDNGILTLRGERRDEHEEKSERVHRVERSYGRFVRSFRLPDNVDPDAVRADYDNGVLTVNIGKKEIRGPEAKRIEIE
ncbi:MAG: Hsp20/alpha crystallin family protein [Myxococcota bacterium]